MLPLICVVHRINEALVVAALTDTTPTAYFAVLPTTAPVQGSLVSIVRIPTIRVSDGTNICPIHRKVPYDPTRLRVNLYLFGVQGEVLAVR